MALPRKLTLTVNEDGTLTIGGLENVIKTGLDKNLVYQLRGLHKAYDRLNTDYKAVCRSNRRLREQNAEMARIKDTWMKQHTRPHIVCNVRCGFDYLMDIQTMYLEGHCPQCGHSNKAYFARNGAVKEDDCVCKKCGNYLIWDERSLTDDEHRKPE